jgi:hypothetical protein
VGHSERKRHVVLERLNDQGVTMGEAMGLNSKCTRLCLQVTATRDNALRQCFGQVTYVHATHDLPSSLLLLLLYICA